MDQNIQVKLIVYANDICILIDSPSDFERLNSHLQRYSNISNTKFNNHKTEAFSLSGNKIEMWENILMENKVLTYHNKFSENPFRYLGFYVRYTKNHRDIIQSKLMKNIKDQVYKFSQRRLSLRGRFTLWNILILSKVWYCKNTQHNTTILQFHSENGLCIYLAKEKTPYLSQSIIYTD